MPSHFALVDLPDILEGISSITSILGLVVGASFVAASWQTGTISTILTWEPRRLRWFASRILVLAAGVLVVTLRSSRSCRPGSLVAAMLRGSTVGVDGAWWTDVLSTSLRYRRGGVDLRGDRWGGRGGRAAHGGGARRRVRLDGGDRRPGPRACDPTGRRGSSATTSGHFLSWQTTGTRFDPFASFTITPGRAAVRDPGLRGLPLALGFTFVRIRDVQ